MSWVWFWQSFSINGPNLLCNRKYTSSVCSYLAVYFSSCHQTWLCMTPAALWPFRCLHHLGFARWTAAADFPVSTVSVHLLFSLRKLHVNQNDKRNECVIICHTSWFHSDLCTSVGVIPLRSTTTFSLSSSAGSFIFLLKLYLMDVLCKSKVSF